MPAEPEELQHPVLGKCSFYGFYSRWYDGQTDTIIIRMSLRFRKPSELKYQETGHPPFIVKA